MARSRNRLALSIESLEKREVLTASGPTDQAQYMLEVLNLARTKPTEAAGWVRDKVDSTIQANLNFYGINLDEVTSQIAAARTQQPLAWNDRLAAAAQQQAGDMAANGFQSHDGSTAETRTVEQRLDRAGYTDRASFGENGFAYTRGSGEKAVDNAMQAFLIDWGVSGSPHRRNIQQPDRDADSAATEVGLAINSVTRSDLLARGFGPTVVTQVFGRPSNSKPQIVGVAYQDRDGDGRFSYQEGQGDVAVEVTNVDTHATKTVQTWDAGGYQIEVEPGTYQIAARVGSKSLGSKTVTIGRENVKVDFNVDKVVAEPAPAAPTPAPVVVKVATPPAASTSRPTAGNATPTVTSTPSPNRVKLTSSALESGFEAASVRILSNPAPTAPASDRGDTTTAVNFTASDAPVVQGQVVTTTSGSSSSLKTAAVDQAVGNGGLLKDWLTSKVVWGQGWKATS